MAAFCYGDDNRRVGVGGRGSGVEYSNPSASEPMFNNPTAAPITGQSIFGGGEEEDGEEPTTTTNRGSGICVPNYAPGLEFWKDNSAREICGQANAKCVVVYEKGLIGGSDIVRGLSV